MNILLTAAELCCIVSSYHVYGPRGSNSENVKVAEHSLWQLTS